MPAATLHHEIVPHDAYAAVSFRECFIDELARAAWRDPVQYRREMLPPEGRLRRVLDEAARVSDWSRPLGEGLARGVALSAGPGAAAAHVAQVQVDALGATRLQRMTIVVDGDPGAVAELARRGMAPAIANAMAMATTLVRAREREGVAP